ncbi:MAG: hypothetical protein L0Y54_06830 [Sporichthyaceae bacterium]|nr:hypothetical protein [Sporichthyaceae bacterium]
MAAAGRRPRGRERRTEYVPLNHHSERITDGWTRTGRREEAERPDEAPVPGGAGHLVGEIDPGATRASLHKIAKRLAVKGRSTMTRKQLYAAITAATGATAAAGRRHR